MSSDPAFDLLCTLIKTTRYGVVYPTQAQVDRNWRAYGGMGSAPDLRHYSARLQRYGMAAYAAARARPLPTAAKPAPRPDPAPREPRAPKSRPRGPAAVPAEWEARIREMPYAEMAGLARGAGLTWEEDAPNPGIRTMRLRNVLYTHLRNGGRL